MRVPKMYNAISFRRGVILTPFTPSHISTLYPLMVKIYWVINIVSMSMYTVQLFVNTKPKPNTSFS